MGAPRSVPTWALFAVGAAVFLLPPTIVALFAADANRLHLLADVGCGFLSGFCAALALCSLPLTRRGG